MIDFWLRLFDPSGFVPRKDCGEWGAGLVWLHNASDALIWLAYVCIPVVLVTFIRRRRDLPFPTIFWLFGLFIVSCGFTHFMEVVMFYWPVYRFAGLLKAVTAAASVGTVAALVPIVPRALALRGPEELAREVDQRRRAEEALQRANAELESKVRQRTAELTEANRALRQEVEVRRRAEEGLRRNEERLRLAVEAAGLGTWHWDLPTGRLDFSDRCRALFGIPPEGEMSYDRFRAALHADDRTHTDEAVRQSLERLADYDTEYRSVWPDGSVHWLAARGRGYADASGKPVRMEGVVLDVSARKEMERQLRQRAAELAEADRRKDEFLAMLAHELRNPLAPIRNALQILRAPGLPEDRARWAQGLLERQVEHVTRLVDDLLDVSRITGGKIQLRREAVTLQEVVGRAVEAVAPLAEARGQRLVVALPEEPVALHADPTRLAQVVGNLLHNATKYTDAGGRIDVVGEAAGGEAVVRVRDNGVGMPADLVPHVFDLFRQGDRSLARSEGGLGIGLTLVRELVGLHGGRVEARSDGPGKGSEFVVRLPLAGGLAPGRREADGEGPAGAPRRVLVVDDHRDGADSLALLLRAEGHEVRVAYDGAEALAGAGAFRPEAVLLDIGLPRMDGYEVARRLREVAGLGRFLLVALTGYGQEADRRRALEAGFDEHLVKPADLRTLRRLLAGAAAPAAV